MNTEKLSPYGKMQLGIAIRLLHEWKLQDYPNRFQPDVAIAMRELAAFIGVAEEYDKTAVIIPRYKFVDMDKENEAP